MATVDYAAACEAIEDRASLDVWPNIRRLGKNRVDSPNYPTSIALPFFIAARLSKEEAAQGIQVVEFLVEVFDVLAGDAVCRVDIAEPVRDVSSITPGPVGHPLILTPEVVLELPAVGVYLTRVAGWHGHYDFLLSAL